MKQEKLKCPVCNATEKANGEPFGSKSSVCQHVWRSTDKQHKGLNYQDAEKMLAGKDIERDTDSDTPSEPQDTDTPSDTPRTPERDDTPQDDPAKAGPQVEEPETSDTSSDTEEDLHCPDCGPRGELVDYRNHGTDPEEGFPTPDDYYCVECGQGWNEQ